MSEAPPSAHIVLVWGLARGIGEPKPEWRRLLERFGNGATR